MCGVIVNTFDIVFSCARIAPVTYKTKYGGREYTYTESGSRARLTEDGLTVWWGDSRGLIPSGAAPIVVLLEFSVMREAR